MKHSAEFEITVYRGEEIRKLLPTINSWVTHYRKFPFLYVGEGETPPNHILADDPKGMAIFAEKNGKKIGLLLGIPLTSTHLDTKYSPYAKINEMKKKGYNPEHVLYVPAFLTEDEERQNTNLINKLFEKASEIGKKMGKSQICYFTTVRESNHPLRPKHFVSPEPWEDLPISFKEMGIPFELSWPTLQADGSVKLASSQQALYIGNISK